MSDYKPDYDRLAIKLCLEFAQKKREREAKEAKERMDKKIREAGGLVEYFNKLVKEREAENTDDTEE